MFAQQEPEYDEINIFLNVQQVGGTEIPGVVKGTDIYLPITNIFDFLRIRNKISADLDSVSGFFINPQSPYFIDKKQNKIVYKEKVFDLKPDDFIRTETNLYLRSNYFGEVFGLDCAFNFRMLAVMLTTKLELPVIREMRQEMMRANITKLKGEGKADTVIGRSYPFFHFGMADWSVIATQQINGLTDTRVNLALGSILAGGETNIAINYSTREPFTEKEQYYSWRFANNNHSGLRQAVVGKINSQATSSIYAPVVGFQLTNTPTTYRRSFGTYQLSDHTEPGWIVELYVNNVLVDYVKADASGFFTFQVPLVYGNTVVKLRFYGPWGEEKASEKNISIPFNFLPPKELEYTASAGIVEDSMTSRYSRGSLNYGLSRRLTIGGGVEYLSSVTSGNTMPFLNMSLRLASSLLISGEYTYSVRFKGLLSYRLPSNLQFDLLYLNYDKNQKAINHNILEERKAVLSVPLIGKNFYSFARLTLDQMIMPATQTTTAELLLSGAFLGVNTNFTTYAMFMKSLPTYVYSNLSLSFRLPGRTVLTPQTQFQYTPGKFISVKCELEKNIFLHGYANLSFEQNFLSNISNIQVGLKYDFSFAQTGLTFRRGNNSNTLIESARGSMVAKSKLHYFGLNNRTNVGRGGIVILPYLDMNCNGHRDKDEPAVAGLTVRVNGGRVEVDKKDSLIRVMDLEPYTNYLIELDRNSFDNIAWQLRKQTLSVAVDPNQLKLVEVPVAVLGEASGMVYIQSPKGKFGQGRIIICFYDKDSKLVGKTVTEAEGYFSFLGLAPGSYKARIDSAQMKKLHMISKPVNLEFNLAHSKEGDVVDNLEFVISREKEDPVVPETPAEKKIIPPVEKKEIIPVEKKEANPVKQPVTPAKEIKPETDPKIKKSENTGPGKKKEVVKTVPGNQQVQENPGFSIQVGAFSNEANASATQQKLSKDAKHPVKIVTINGFFKVLVGGFSSRKEATDFLPELSKQGYPGFIVPDK